MPPEFYALHTDLIYQGQSVGVKYCNSHHIKIVEALNTQEIHDEVIGPVSPYYLSNTKSALKGGAQSYLRRLQA